MNWNSLRPLVPAPPVISFAFLLLLSGCLPAPKPADPNRLLVPAARIRAECASQSTHLAQERCASPRIIELYAAEGTPRDVAAAYMARREAIAERIDRGEISETEGKAEMAEAAVRANAAAQGRERPTVVCTTASGVTVCR
jgi:hypothetical protein